MPENNIKTLAEMRKDAGKTQSEIANAIGVSTRTYQRYESNENDIPTAARRKLDAIFHPEKYENTDNSQINQEIDRLVNKILEANGPQLQACILIEEMSELTKILCKIQRGKFNRGKLNEEFTHVQISCEVIRRIMSIKNEDILEQVKLKLDDYVNN